MARKALILKQQRAPKYSTRAYTRCSICGRPHAVLKKYGICRVCFRELAYKGEIPGVKNRAGKSYRRNKMVVTDPIADMLTRIRNALTAKHESVEIPASNMKKAIAEILLNEGYVSNVEFKEDEVQGSIVVTLKYSKDGNVITGLKRISKPGLRVYAKSNEIPKVLNGLGIAILSTSKGIMTDKQARANNLGGEVLAFVW